LFHTSGGEKVAFADDMFLGTETRTAPKHFADTPSACTRSSRFVLPFDLWLTYGESSRQAVTGAEDLRSVVHERVASCAVNVTLPMFGIGADYQQQYDKIGEQG
jgi:hypothetical protein